MIDTLPKLQKLYYEYYQDFIQDRMNVGLGINFVFLLSI